jgi:ribA/ribD-fused uncharacterized protein
VVRKFCDGSWQHFSRFVPITLEEYNAMTPGQVKRLGRRIPLRWDWEQVKERIMLEAVRSKFKANPQLAMRLVATGDEEIVKLNWWHDNEWGKCTCPNCSQVIGKNLLGRILMQVRKELQQ